MILLLHVRAKSSFHKTSACKSRSAEADQSDVRVRVTKAYASEEEDWNMQKYLLEI